VPTLLEPVRPAFRALARAIVPEARELDESGWLELEAVVEEALGKRPAGLQRQLLVFVRALDTLPRLRWGRPFRRLDPVRAARFLRAVERSRVFLVRRGFWGLRTLVLMGYYTRPAAYEAVGYGARLRGWLDHPDAPAALRDRLAATPGVSAPSEGAP
jgi:hypothetical protein